MSASAWSWLGKLHSSSSTLRSFTLLRTFQNFSVGPVSPLMAMEAAPSVITYPHDSTGWLTSTDFTA